MQIFNLDLSARGVIPLLYAKQRDVGAKILVNITNNGDAYAIPAGASLSVWYSGASGEGNYTSIGENSAFSIKGNTVTVELIMQMLNNPGEHVMCLVMNDANGNQQGLWNIPYFVEAIPGADSQAAVQYYQAFLQAQAKAEEAAERAKDSAGATEEQAEIAKDAAAQALESAMVAEKAEKDAMTFAEDVNSAKDYAELAATSAKNSAEKAAEAAKSVNPDILAKMQDLLAGAENLSAEAVAAAERAEKAAEQVEDSFAFAKAEGQDGVVQVSTTNNDNTAYSPTGAAFGMNTVAGIKGFRMTDIVVGEDGKITITVDDANLTEKALASYAVGDELQFDAKLHHYSKLKIVELRESTIVAEQTTDETLSFALDADPIENYCWVVGKNYGEIFPMARAAFSTGESTIAAGRCAHAEGRSTKAIGGYSHAEGRGTIAGYCAHAEGKNASALGNHSHAEGGGSTATGDSSHAEGVSTKAVGDSSHAEGFETEANGMYSHAEGGSTKAIGARSHAEGESTIARGRAQHVAGKYNEEDTELDQYGYGKYAHILGGGYKDHRKNIHTVDWEGNAWYGGSLALGNTTITVTQLEALLALLKHPIFGKWPNPTASTLFAVGNGTSDTDRSNALEVRDNSIVVNGQELTSDTIGDIATKSDIQEYINSLGVVEGVAF